MNGAGRYAEAADRGRELLAEAIAHLRRAMELADVTREYAAQDSDLDSIRDDPAFAALLAASGHY